MLENYKMSNIEDEANKPKRRREYTLSFDEKTAQKIRAFCDSFFIELNHFFERTMVNWLYFVLDDIDIENFLILIGYYDLSKLNGVQIAENSSQVNEKKCKFKISFRFLISNAIERYCALIHWTPEEFIQDTVKWKIDSILSDIKNEDYEFISIYLDFSKVKESIEKIDDEDYNEDDN